VRLSDGAIACLAPAIAPALIDPDPPLALGRMVEDDRRVLERLRAAVPRWLACVDRMTPTEIFGELLAETAYRVEMGDARGAQARENLKKLRGMVARFQNRGYATIARVADHLEQLAVGDESNAALDARDSVSLMTVHAAKGLEFPIVFVVNFGRGTGSARAPIRVSAGPDGEASVAIADFQSEADEDVQARDREETKRLLYVALTRARDRLYLSTPVQGEVCRMGRGSLGEVLPASFRTVLISAAALGDRLQVITWGGPSGMEHRFVVSSALQNQT
jgi:ATP-dependent exoDNAse (exonuclease V) beta subunit